jgi:DNA-binding MarR family transcriptional regulator
MKRRASRQPHGRASQGKELHDHIVDRTCRLADAMLRMSASHISDRWKLRPTDLRLLIVLDGEEGLPVREISRRALVDQAWVSRSLRSLEADKLVEKRSDPADSRLTLVSLTKRGRSTLDEFRPWAAWSEKLLLEGVDADQLKALLDQLEANTEALLERIQAAPAGPPRNPPKEK